MNNKNNLSQDKSVLKLMEDHIEKVIKLLVQKKQTLSFAESCTGGLLSAKTAEVSGVSAIYKGSIVSYSNEAKVEILGVSTNSLQAQGAVSEPVAQQMAQGVRDRFHTDWGISITGIAGPNGGSQEKPVGTVWIAVSGSGFASSAQDSDVEARKYFFKGDRKQIQEQSAKAALELLIEKLKIENES